MLKQELTDQRSNDLLNGLRTLTQDLFYISESEYPFQVYGLEAHEDLLEDIYEDASLSRVAKSLELTPDFFLGWSATSQDWHTDEDKAIVEKFQALLNFVNTNLSDAKVFKLGQIQVKVYLCGKAPNGDYIILKTTSIET